ncbi:unnamed protein product [Chrysodeixis includens]|uniref:Uncharacterized protein n=1 Tax=Chrysodeixis includens TaxID=689277 RepID=A0A9N8KXY7_CHRIL|nr:unnamed protein product [Chrysodeixis includens]
MLCSIKLESSVSDADVVRAVTECSDYCDLGLCRAKGRLLLQETIWRTRVAAAQPETAAPVAYQAAPVAYQAAPVAYQSPVVHAAPVAKLSYAASPVVHAAPVAKFAAPIAYSAPLYHH